MKQHVSYKRINCWQTENIARLVKCVLWTDELKCPLSASAGFPSSGLTMFVTILTLGIIWQ